MDPLTLRLTLLATSRRARLGLTLLATSSLLAACAAGPPPAPVETQVGLLLPATSAEAAQLGVVGWEVRIGEPGLQLAGVTLTGERRGTALIGLRAVGGVPNQALSIQAKIGGRGQRIIARDGSVLEDTLAALPESRVWFSAVSQDLELSGELVPYTFVAECAVSAIGTARDCAGAVAASPGCTTVVGCLPTVGLGIQCAWGLYETYTCIRDVDSPGETPGTTPSEPARLPNPDGSPMTPGGSADDGYPSAPAEDPAAGGSADDGGGSSSPDASGGADGDWPYDESGEGREIEGTPGGLDGEASSDDGFGAPADPSSDPGASADDGFGDYGGADSDGADPWGGASSDDGFADLGGGSGDASGWEGGATSDDGFGDTSDWGGEDRNGDAWEDDWSGSGGSSEVDGGWSEPTDPGSTGGSSDDGYPDAPSGGASSDDGYPSAPSDGASSDDGYPSSGGADDAGGSADDGYPDTP